VGLGRGLVGGMMRIVIGIEWIWASTKYGLAFRLLNVNRELPAREKL
jgi:hypothetical protein